jgi:competence protein ComEA
VDGWLERYRGPLFFVVVVIALAGVLLFQVFRPAPAPDIMDSLTPAPSPEPTPTARLLRVYVSGAVRKPEVYTLGPDSIVKDAIEAAGGASGSADLDRINLASPVADGQHVYVPELGEENPPVQPPSNQPDTGAKVNINTSAPAALEALPGIGPALAQRIIDYREENGPFSRPEDVMNVSGIGPATFEKLEGYITTH